MVEREIGVLLERLLQAGLAEREGELIHLTLLGRACGASSLSFESSLRLVELMKQFNAGQTTPTHVLAMVQVLDEMDAIYTPVMKRGRSESVRADDVAQRYGQAMAQALQGIAETELRIGADASVRSCCTTGLRVPLSRCWKSGSRPPLRRYRRIRKHHRYCRRYSLSPALDAPDRVGAVP